MLAVARKRAEDRGCPQLHEGDAEALPVEDAAYDSVVCTLSLCTIPDPAAAIAEMKRALAPGGRLLLLDHVGSTWPPIYALFWLAERVSIRTRRRALHATFPAAREGGGLRDRGVPAKEGRDHGAIHAVKPGAPPPPQPPPK